MIILICVLGALLTYGAIDFALFLDLTDMQFCVTALAIACGGLNLTLISLCFFSIVSE